jgi:hypothetical protein
MQVHSLSWKLYITDDNGIWLHTVQEIWLHTVQEHNKRTSTEFNLVTA